MKRTLGNVALLLVSVVFVLSVIEVALRLYNPFNQRLRFGSIVLPRNRTETMHNDLIPGFPAVVVKHRNSLGFRGAEPPANFERYLSIVTVGGSTTEAAYEPDGATWTDRVGTTLADCFSDVWINNAGLEGHTTFGHLVLLRDYLTRLHPKVAIFLVGANDRFWQEPNDWEVEMGVGGVDTTSLKGFGKSVVARLETAALLLNAYRTFRSWHEGAWSKPVEWETLVEGDPYPADADRTLAATRTQQVPAYRTRLVTIAHTARAANILPIFVTQPLVFGPGHDPATNKDLFRVSHGAFEHERMELYNETMREVASTEGVPLIDLAEQLPHDTRLFYDPVHFTSRGDEAVSEIIASEARGILASRFAAYVRPSCSGKK